MTAASPPSDVLASHPETAYFWGRVAADGDLTADCVTVRTNDETAAELLAAFAGGDRETAVDDEVIEREYAHDTAITRAEEEFTVQVFGDLAERASAAFGLPLGGDPGGYRLDALADHRRELCRGLLEGCGTVCVKSDAVGVAFVHDDRSLLETVDGLLDGAPVDTPTGDVSESSSGGYWFGLDDDAVPEFGRWVYEGSDGLCAPSRRRKLLRGIDREAVES
jgi:hypothetical protein